MKYLAKGYIISIICMFITYICTFILAAVFGNILLAGIITIAFGVIISILYAKLKEWYPKRIKKLSHKKFKEFKEKPNLNLFEELYVKAYNDIAIEILENVFNYNSIDDVKNIDFDSSYDKKYITFCFEYKKHKVYYHIYEHKIEYYIDSPEKYDNLDINKEYEKISMINISINDFNSLEIFFNSLVDIFHKNIESIDKFEYEADAFIIDKKTMDEILDYKDFNKSTNIFLNVLCLVMVLPMGFALTFYLIKEFNSIIEQDGLAQTIIGIIALAFLDIFFVFSYIYSVYCLVKVKIIDTDIKKQNIEYITGKPIKVKFIKTSVGYRHSVHKFCSGIMLYFDSPKKVKLLFAHYFDIPSKEKQNKIKELIINKNYELTYYKRSKLIVKGMERDRKKLKE